MKKIIGKDIAQIAKMRALGYTQVEIAKKLNISQTTVAYHLKKLREMSKKVGDDKVFTDIVVTIYYAPISKVIKGIIKEAIE